MNEDNSLPIEPIHQSTLTATNPAEEKEKAESDEEEDKEKEEEEGEEEGLMTMKKKKESLSFEAGTHTYSRKDHKVSWEESSPRIMTWHQRNRIVITWPMIKSVVTSKRLWLILLNVTLLGIGAGIMIAYSKTIINFFVTLVTAIQDAGPIGYVLMVLAIFITTWPPVIGYAYLLIGSGFIYGWLGFIPAYIGSVSGGICCFLAARYLLHDWVQRKAMAYPKFALIEKAIAKEGLHFVVLIRIAPYPYPVFNLLFAASSVPFWTFVLGTMIAQAKILIHIYIGLSLQNVRDIVDGTTGVWTYVFIALAVSITVILSVYVCWKSRSILAKYQAEADAQAQDEQEGDEEMQNGEELEMHNSDLRSKT